MGYSISEVAKKLDITAYTIRYYDKMGLLTKMERDESGKRCFSKEDIDRLAVIKCLKLTGMTVADIKKFIMLYSVETDTLERKREMITLQKKMLEEKVEFLNQCIEQSDFKLWFYDHMVIDGVEPEYSDESYQSWKQAYVDWKKSLDK